MDAIEQAVPEQPRYRRAQHRLRRRRNELHRAVAAMARNDVAHVPRQQAISIFLDIKQRDAGARQRFRAEGEPGGIERRRRDAERHATRRAAPCSLPAPAACPDARTRSAARHSTAPARMRMRPRGATPKARPRAEPRPARSRQRIRCRRWRIATVMTRPASASDDSTCAPS